MTKHKPEKKTETLEVRLPHSKKEAFKAACEAEGITVSHAVRSFVDAYLKRSKRMRLKLITREVSMTLIRNPIKTTTGLFGTLGAAFAVFSLTATPSFADRDAQPIQPPIPQYPMDLAKAGISADCEAIFNVSADGYIEDGLEVECTHPGFVEATRKAALTLQFAPKIVDGKAARRTGVRYPISYQLISD